MADLKITSLPALAEAGIQATDVLALADLSATETKKVTVKDLVAAAVALLDSGDIPAAKVATPFAANSVATTSIQNDAINADKLATDSVTADAVAANAIGASELANNAVDSGALATNSVITSKITDLNVTTDKLASNAVTTVKILDANVTYAKLNLTDGDIPGAKITGNSITSAQIGTNAVGASELADDAVDTNAIADNAVTNVKLANTSVSLGGVSISLGATDATPAFNLTDATNYPASSLAGTITNAQLAGSITGDKLTNATVTYAKLNISDGDIAGAKIAGNSITAAQIATNAVTASELADDAVDTAAVADAAITSAKIAANTITAGNLAANSVGASELADNAVDTAAVANGAITRDKIADGAINAAKLDGTISATSIGDNTVTSSKIAANAVGAAEIADNAVDTSAVANAAITNDKVASGISGTKIGDGTITAAKLNTTNIDRSLNVASGKLGINNVITAGTRSGISYNAQGLITGTVALAAGDLPVATTSAVGGVSIASAGGLAVTGAGAISIAATTTGATATKVTFNNFGQITGSASLAASDLPKATASAVGGVSVPSGGPLSVDSNGALTVGNSGVSAGTGTKVTVNAKGIVTAINNLSDSDLPNHSAALLTSGSIAAARIGNDTIDGTKLSNASTAIFQSIAQSGYPTAQFNGQILFDTVSEDAFIWDGNAWQAITTLTKGSLVFGGTYNANTSKMVSTTTAGIAAGLAVGSNLPSPSSNTDGVYVVVDTAGTPSAPAPVVAFSPPDYILGVTNSSGSSWNEIDLSQTVAGQIAGNITFTPYGQLSSTNVQDALQELETEKMGLAGGTITGQVLIGNTGSLVFEGSTVDAYETTITVADPTTSDKTITFPDTTGTVITTGDTGTVTGTMLANDTIQNVDIKSDAAIAFSKLAALTSAQILVGNGSNVVTGVAVTGDISINNAGLTAIAAGVIVDSDISGSAAITGSKIATGTTSAVGVLQLTDSATSTSATTAATPAAVKIAKDAADAAATTANAALPKAGGTMTGNLILDNAKELRLSEADSDGAHFTGFKAQAQSADITYTLPATAPTTGQVLKAGSTATTLEWAADSATDATKLPLAGGTMSGALNMGNQNITNGGTITGTFVGDITGDVTGNADTATTLATARTIGGVSFNGSANINLPGVNASGTQDTSGNAATATKLASSVNIGGVAFDGSASINLPGVNATGNQDTTGNAASFTVTANNSTDETVYLLFADGATGSQGAESDTGLTYNPSTGLLTSTSFAGNITGNVTGNCSGTSGGFTAGSASNLNAGTLPDARFPSTLPAASGANLTALNASNLSSGTVNVARLGSGSSVSTKFLRGDNTWQTISATPEGTAILSTGESGGTKFLREDGDGTCSWQSVVTSAAGSNTQVQFNNSGSFAGSSSLTFNSGTGALTATSFVGNLTGTVQTAAQANITSLGTLTGLTVNGDLGLTGAGGNILWDKSEDSLEIDDDVTVYWGDGADLSIKHLNSGTLNHIHSSATGGLDFKVTGGALRFKSESGGSDQTGATYTPAAGWSFGHAGTTRLATSSSGVAVTGGLTVSGDLTVSGTTTTVNSTTVEVADKNIELGKVSSPSDTTADGGGLTLKGSSDKTFNWVNSTDAWTSSEHIQVASGKTFIGDGSTLTALNASNISSGTIAAARLGSGTASSSNFLRGDGSWQAVTSTTINNNANNRVITGSGTANTLEGEANLTYDGSGLTIAGSDTNKIILTGANGPAIDFQEGTTQKGLVQWSTSGYMEIWNREDSSKLRIKDDLAFSDDGSTFYSVLTSNSNLNASKLSSGTVATARLGTGTASSSTFLRGDGSWQTVGTGTGESYVKIKSGASLSDTGTTTYAGYTAGNALAANSDFNTLFGYRAGLAINSGNKNTCIGSNSGESITSAEYNTLLGFAAGDSITTGNNNTISGQYSAAKLTTGGYNTFYGSGSGMAVTTGSSNIAIGSQAIGYSSGACTGTGNIGIGTDAAYQITGGLNNVAIGEQSGRAISTGSINTLVGYRAGYEITTPQYNVCIGSNSGGKISTGAKNVSVGSNSGGTTSGSALTGDSNTSVGYDALNSIFGSAADNTAIGSNAGGNLGAGADNNICIGHDALASSSSATNEATIGDASIAKFRIPGINFVLKDNGGTPSEGQVLTADGSGEGYWADASGGGGSTPTVKTSNYTASSGDMVVINGTGLTITLPSGPSAGDSVKIRILGDRYCTVARNSQNIEGNASNFYVDVFDGCATFTYADSTRGWLVGC